MRKLKLFFAALALLTGGGNLSVFATDWVGNAVEAGDYYLYNVGADRFLGFGANWGTKATADHAGIPITVVSGEGSYTLKTNVVNDGNKLFSDGYVDGGSDKNGNWSFTTAGVEGKNVYYISIGDKFLCYDNTTTEPNYALSVKENQTGSIYAQWQLVSKEDRDNAFSAMNATEAKPLDLTYKYIENPNTTYYTNIYTQSNPWTAVSNAWDIKGGTTDWWDGKDNNAEVYNKLFDNYIEITNIPNGEYEFGVIGFYRDGDSDAALSNYHAGSYKDNVKIYANNDLISLQSIAVSNQTTEIYINNDKSKEINGQKYYIPNSQLGASLYFIRDKYPWQSVKTIVKDGTLRFGLKKENGVLYDWTIADRFYLSYLGPTISAKSQELPNNEMSIGQWYYFDIAIDGEYDLSLTTLSDMVYTKDESILYENEGTVTDHFSGTQQIYLTAGRYYVKSTSAQSLTVSPHTLSYTVGAPVISPADGTYLQKVTTVDFNFSNTATNDATASFAILDTSAKATLKLSGSTVAEGMLTLNGKVLTATFPETTLSNGSSYTIELPEAVVGYTGHESNAATSITITAPVITDGFYYLYNTYTKNYLSRSGNYGTQAIMDNNGMAVKLTTNSEGKTIIQYFDNLLFVGNDGFCYGDAGTAHQFTVTAVESGYKFLCSGNNKYFAVYDGQSVNDAVEGVNLQGTSNIWALESLADHKTNYDKNADEQAKTVVANITELSNITTKSALDSKLSSDYCETGINITGAKNAKYQVYAGTTQTLSEAEYYKETVEGLKPGLYKLSVDAFQRAAWYDWVNAAGGARGNIYVYANESKTQLKSVMEYGAENAYTGGSNPNINIDNKNYPNNDDAAYAALATGNYTNDVYVYVAADEGKETGTLVFGINNPTRQGNGVNNGTWAVYNNFRLTFFEAKATEAEKTALAQAISDAESKTLGFENGEYAPYNNVAALETLAAAKAVSVNDASGVAVVAATTALTSATWTANASQLNAVYNGTFALTANGGAPAGWVLTGATGSGNSSNVIGGQYRPRAFVLGASDANYAKLASFNQEGDTRSAFYVRFDDRTATNAVFTYGETEGYTMPLKAATYRLKAKAGGWGKTLPLQFNIYNSTDETVVVKSVTLEDIDKTGTASDYIMYFQVTTPGTYKLKVTNSSGASNAAAISNIELYPTSTVDFVDGQAVPAYAPGTYSQVKLTRTLAKNRWYTAVYPFAISADESGYDQIAVLDSYDPATGVLKFKSANASEANVPFLFRGTNSTFKDEAQPVTLSWQNVNLVVASTEPVATAGQASLIGTYEEQTLSTNEEYKNYVLSNNTIYPVGAAGATIPAYRAYIQIAQTGGAARSLKFVIDGEETTGIDGIAAESVSRGEVYNLNGQRVASPRKGLYIQNGKKVLVK